MGAASNPTYAAADRGLPQQHQQEQEFLGGVQNQFAYVPDEAFHVLQEPFDQTGYGSVHHQELPQLQQLPPQQQFATGPSTLHLPAQQIAVPVSVPQALPLAHHQPQLEAQQVIIQHQPAPVLQPQQMPSPLQQEQMPPELLPSQRLEQLLSQQQLPQLQPLQQLQQLQPQQPQEQSPSQQQLEQLPGQQPLYATVTDEVDSDAEEDVDAVDVSVAKVVKAKKARSPRKKKDPNAPAATMLVTTFFCNLD